jgi:hypothetical protein
MPDLDFSDDSEDKDPIRLVVLATKYVVGYARTPSYVLLSYAKKV